MRPRWSLGYFASRPSEPHRLTTTGHHRPRRLHDPQLPLALPALFRQHPIRDRCLSVRSGKYVTSTATNDPTPCAHPCISSALHLTAGIWHFTLWWTLLLLGGTFFLCSLWASFTLLLSLTTYRDNAAPLQSIDKPPPSEAGTLRARRRLRRKRPPFWPLVVLPLVMSAISALVALISGTIVGFSLAAVYSAGGFTMSTWVALR